MKLRLLTSFTAASAVLLTLLGTASAVADTISVFALPATGTDAASGISTANTYLDAFDFGNYGSVGSTLTINGVSFTHFNLGVANNTVNTVSTTDPNFGGTLTISSSGPGPDTDRLGQANSASQGSLSSQADGSMYSMFPDMFYITGPADANSVMTLDFGGLTAGDQYSLRIYTRSWGNTFPGRNINVSFNGEGTAQAYSGNPFVEDTVAGAGGAQYIEYDFTAASTDVTGSFENLVSNGSFQLFGASLQVIPEPTVASLLAVGGLLLGLLCWRRATRRTSNT